MNRKIEDIVSAIRCSKTLMLSEYVVDDEDVKLLLEEVNDFEETADRNGLTYLMHAVISQRVEIVNFLIKNGVDVNRKDSSGFTALHFAVLSRDVEITKIILEAGADVNAKNKFGNNPVMLGNLATPIELYKLLMDYGTDPFQKNNYGICAADMFLVNDDIMKVLKNTDNIS